MAKAAGIMFVSNDGKRVLLLRRVQDEEDPYGGHWAFPAGSHEEGETALDCAKRELREECGEVSYDDKQLRFWTRAIRDETDFTTHIAVAEEDFAPTLNEEHDAYAWVPFDEIGKGKYHLVHPGLWIALNRKDMDELDMALAIRNDKHVSPCEFLNMMLVKIRITGTGLSYRNVYDEYVWRKPELYLTQRFLDRCNGLPVIWEHPKDGQPLDSKEYHKRIVGSVFFAYAAHWDGKPEIWAIAKIWDADAMQAIKDEQLSTSPCVVFYPEDMGMKLPFEGKQILVEGKPSFIDHIALCASGVWDKGGEPTGVESATVSDDADDGLTQIDAILRKCRLDYVLRQIISKR